MKSFDIDSKQLIRNYVDSIEEYLRNHTRLHPNEIDGLLNEINDFVYLRSRDLAVGERVHYSDVLRAIEECGSPSEICEQYLESDQDESREDHSEKIVFKPKIELEKARYEERGSREEVIPRPPSSRLSFDYFGDSYRHARIFGLYRALFVALITIQLIGFSTYLPIDHYYYNVNYYSGEIIPFFVFSALGYDLCMALTIYVGLLILLECWVINRWKMKLVKERRINRRPDDNLVAWISRISFLVIFLKTSLLFVPAYIVFIPIWVVLALIVERSLQSELWEKKLSPGLMKIGFFLSNSEYSGFDFEMFQQKFRTEHTRDELGVALIPLTLLAISFFVLPFIPFYGWSIYSYFMVVGMILVLFLIIYYRWKNFEKKEIFSSKIFYGESELIAWLIRLLSLKALMVVVILYHDSTIFLQFLIIILWISIEIFTSSLGGESTRFWLGGLLVQFSSSKPPQISDSRIEERKIRLKESKFSEVSSIVKIPSQKPPQEVDNVEQVQPVEQESIPPSTVVERQVIITQKKSPWIFRFIGSMLKAVIMSISMLLLTVFEVALISSIVVTNFTRNATYQLPRFHFDLSWISPSYSNIITPDYTVYVWYALILLGVQIFGVAILEYYGLSTKSPEGVVVRLSRNLSRIMIIILLAGALVRIIYYTNNYAMLELMLLAIFLIFNEVNAWKVRSERNNWRKSDFSRGFKNQKVQESTGVQPRSL